jgi:hypothetical protein
MHEAFTSYNMANVLVNVPKYAILIIVLPMLTLTLLKIWMTARATSKGKPKREWVLSRTQDEQGIPLLAEVAERPQSSVSQRRRRA